MLRPPRYVILPTPWVVILIQTGIRKAAIENVDDEENITPPPTRGPVNIPAPSRTSFLNSAMALGDEMPGLNAMEFEDPDDDSDGELRLWKSQRNQEGLNLVRHYVIIFLFVLLNQTTSDRISKD